MVLVLERPSTCHRVSRILMLSSFLEILEKVRCLFSSSTAEQTVDVINTFKRMFLTSAFFSGSIWVVSYQLLLDLISSFILSPYKLLFVPDEYPFPCL